MLKNLIYDNGSQTLDLCTHPDMYVSDIQGVSALGIVNSVSIPGYDGGRYVSCQSEKRAISIMVGFKGNGDHERNVAELYKAFRLEKEGTLYYVSDYRDVQIKARVTVCTINHYANPFTAQIQLECLQPFWESSNHVQDIAYDVDCFEFEFESLDTPNLEFGIINDGLVNTISNEGDVDTGAVFRISAIGNLSNPKIINLASGETMQVEVDMVADDVLTINTSKGHKGITFTHGKITTNYINHKVAGFKFLQLAVGETSLMYGATSGESNMRISVEFPFKFGGV